jgi:iron complex transport system substrate-binding protein
VIRRQVLLCSPIARQAAIWFVVGLLVADSASAASGHSVVDSVGREVEVPASLQRIVSLAPSVTEILFVLEVEEQLIAVTDFCDYPAAATRKLKVGGYTIPISSRSSACDLI